MATRLLKNPTKVLTDCDNIDNIDGQRMATVLGKHIAGYDKRPDNTRVDRVLGVDAQGDVRWSKNIPGGGGGESYTAGNGISISDENVISADTSVVQPKLTAGTNVTISDQNVISAVDTFYQAGTGLNLTSGNTFNVDTDVIQEKLTAGSNITISDNVISADTPDNVALFSWDANPQIPQLTYSAALAAYNAKKNLVLYDFGGDTSASAKPVAVTSQYEFGTGVGPHDVPVDIVKFRYDGINNGTGQASYSIKYAASSNGSRSKHTNTFDIGKVNDVKVNGTSVLDSDNVAQISLPDFTQYATTSAMNTALAGKQGTLTAGTNITIDASNVISATATTPNDGVLTIQRNGTTLDTFSANQSGNTTVNLEILNASGDAGSHDWTSGDGSYVDLVIDMPYSMEEMFTRCLIEVGGFRALEGVNVDVPSNYIDYAEIWLGTGSNHAVKQVGRIDHAGTGTNGFDFDNGGYWTMSHLYGDNLTVVDKLTVRLYKQSGATITGVTTGCKINVVQFK